jgi:hypothetical protein
MTEPRAVVDRNTGLGESRRDSRSKPLLDGRVAPLGMHTRLLSTTHDRLSDKENIYEPTGYLFF